MLNDENKKIIKKTTKKPKSARINLLTPQLGVRKKLKNRLNREIQKK
jgi:hypothetical protein